MRKSYDEYAIRDLNIETELAQRLTRSPFSRRMNMSAAQQPSQTAAINPLLVQPLSYHTAAYQISSTGSAFPTIAPVITDTVMTPTGNGFQSFPSPYNAIYAAAAVGPNITRAQITAPSLGVKRFSPEIVPRRVGANFSLTTPEYWVPQTPYGLNAGEEVDVNIADNGAVANLKTALIWFSAKTGPTKMPAGDGYIRMIRATATKTLTANAWTNTSITPDTSLEAGSYSLVGFLPISANIYAARAVITGQPVRPAGIGFAGTEAVAADLDSTYVLIGPFMFKDLGRFTHTTIPTFDFLSNTADTAETVFLYVIKLGPAPT